LAQYQILYWHDIPLQVRSGGRRDRVSQALADRFQVAADNAAMKAGLTEDDAYMSGLKWSDPLERPGTPQEVVLAVAAEIEAKYPEIDWRATLQRLQGGASS